MGWQPIHRACDDRRGVQHLVALLRAGADVAAASVAGETPEEICALADPAQGARPEDPAMTKVARLAVLPWHPERHHMFPRSFTPRVVLVLLLQQRIEQRAVQYAWHVRRRRRTRQMRRLEAALNARATVDVWLNSIVPFLPRFGVAVPEPEGAFYCCGEQTVPLRPRGGEDKMWCEACWPVGFADQ